MSLTPLETVESLFHLRAPTSPILFNPAETLAPDLLVTTLAACSAKVARARLGTWDTELALDAPANLVFHVSPVPDTATVYEHKQSLLRGMRPSRTGKLGRQVYATVCPERALEHSWAWPGQREVLVALEVTQMPQRAGFYPRSEGRRYAAGLELGLRGGFRPVGFAMVRRQCPYTNRGERFWARFIPGILEERPEVKTDPDERARFSAWIVKLYKSDQLPQSIMCRHFCGCCHRRRVLARSRAAQTASSGSC